MALSQNKKFTIIGNEISSNIMGMYLKYHLKLANYNNKIDIFHVKPKENNIFNTIRVPFKSLEEGSYITDFNQRFEIKIYNKKYYEELKNIILNNGNKNQTQEDKFKYIFLIITFYF